MSRGAVHADEKGRHVFCPDLVLVEADWVLSSLYDWTRDEVADAMAKLMTLHNLAFENEGLIRPALRALRHGVDLSDELIVDGCRKTGCRNIATFDKGMARRHPHFAAIPR